MTKTITRTIARQIREQLEVALQEVAEQFGLHSQISNTVQFTGNNVRCSIELSVVRDDGVIQGRDADRFRVESFMYGLNAEELGSWFTSSTGTEMQIIGLNPRAKRYPIVCRSKDGLMFKFPATMVRVYLDQASSRVGK